MKMQGRRLFAGLVVAIFATTCLGYASRGAHKSTTTVTFASPTILRNGEKIPAGTYRLEVYETSPTPEVKFYKERTAFIGSVNTPDPMGGGKLMATMTAKVVAQPAKNPTTEVETVTRGDVQVLKTIRPAGWKEELVFGQGGKNNSARTTN